MSADKPASPLLRTINLSHSFPGGIRALEGVGLSLYKEEILGIMGENGAGKSTLMFILSGFMSPGGGEIRMGGMEGTDGRGALCPASFLRDRVGMIHQKPLLAGELTVLENILLEKGRGLIRPGGMKEEIGLVQERYDLPLELGRKVRDLTAPEVQRCELIRALWKDKGIIVLDEPTASLSDRQAGELFTLMKTLKREGKTVLFITHKIHEALDCCDRIAVLRRGRYVGEGAAAEMEPAEISRMMIGSGEAEAGPPPVPRPETGGSSPVLELKGLSYRERGALRLRDISLSLRGGEILGIGGIRENGLIHLENLLSGTIHPSEGEILIDGRSAGALSPFRLRRRGVSYIPAERLVRGASPESTLAENISILNPAGGRGSYRKSLILRAAGFIRRHGIKGEPLQKAGTLSGGNLQKMIVARELGGSPRLVIVAEPSWGLDFKSRELLHRRLREAGDEGTAVLLLTTDLDELLALSDRIFILTEGRLNAIKNIPEQWNRGYLGEKMTGADLV